MTIDMNSIARLRGTAAAAMTPPTPAARPVGTLSRLWSGGWALIGALRLLQGHPWAGALAMVFAALSLPEFTQVARAGGWLIWARAAVFGSLFLAVWALVIAFALDAQPSTKVAAAPSAPSPTVSASGAAEKAAAPVGSNIAAEVVADDNKFMRLTEMGKEQLDAILKDPDSAKYKDVGAYSAPMAKGSVTFCGRVNAKNSFGGYGGYERFISAPNVGAWLQSSPGIKFNSVWHDLCRPDSLVEQAYF
jgi:hypothetical protein